MAASSAVYAIRYAHAFASVAASNNMDVAAAQQQMRDFAGTFSDSPQLREVLTDPSIPAEQKLSVIDAIAERIGMFREVRNFIAVIMDHQRLNELGEILKQYHHLADVNSGLTEAEITSARELNPDDRQELEQQVAKLAGTRVVVAYKQDPSLLGGAVVRIGSKIYDGSLKAQLEQMKQSLVSV